METFKRKRISKNILIERDMTAIGIGISWFTDKEEFLRFSLSFQFFFGAIIFEKNIE